MHHFTRRSAHHVDVCVCVLNFQGVYLGVLIDHWDAPTNLQFHALTVVSYSVYCQLSSGSGLLDAID